MNVFIVLGMNTLAMETIAFKREMNTLILEMNVFKT